MTAILEKTRPAVRRPALMTGAAIPPANRPAPALCDHGPKCTVCAMIRTAIIEAARVG